MKGTMGKSELHMYKSAKITSLKVCITCTNENKVQFIAIYTIHIYFKNMMRYIRLNF